MKASEMIVKLQEFVDAGKDFELWSMCWDDEFAIGDDPCILWDDKERIYL